MRNRYKEDKKLVITCPNCGTEYLPAEIYYPKSFLGNPSNIEKTTLGKVNDYDGLSMNLCEDYTCDRCGAKFKVEAKVSFRTKMDEIKNFNEDYSEPLHKNVLYLNEDL